MGQLTTDSGSAPRVELCQSLEGHQGAIYDLCLAEDGDLISAGGDGLVVAWSKVESPMESPQEFDGRGRALAQCGEPVFSLASVGRLGLFVGTESGAVFTLEPKGEWRQEHRHDGGTYVIARNGTGGADGRWLDLVSGSELTKVQGRIRSVLETENSALKETLIGTSEGRIHSMTSSWVVDAHEGAVRALMHWPGKTAFASAGGDGRIVVWRERPEGPPEPVVSVDAHKGAVYRMQSGPKGRWVATVSRDRSVALWDAKSLELGVRLSRPAHPGHMRSVNALCWVDERTMASAGDDGRILIWRIHPD